MRSFPIPRLRLLLFGLLAVLVVAWIGCSQEPVPTGPEGQIDVESALVGSLAHPRMIEARHVQEDYTPELMAIAGVVGTALGLDDAGSPVIQILTEHALPTAVLPVELDGVQVVQRVTGKIVAFKGPPGGGGGGGGGGVSHTAIQSPPIALGTSGGWEYDLANGYCCGGTLGSLIQIGGNKYVLSNYHVLEADIVSGGNSRVASNNDPVIQPGLIDVSCSGSSAQDVATLVVSHSLPGSNVDAAIAQIVPGMVDASGTILEVGTLSSATVGASIGQAVKKSGRTSGLTRSTIDGLNATISVSYENECAGGSAFTKTFSGQIIIQNRGSKFLAGGDSGSLMVEDVDNDPRAVGLLFAGSNQLAVANPIGEVLSFFNATMVGN